MVEILVALFTAIPVVAAAAAGYRQGGRHLARRWGPWLLAAAAGAALMEHGVGAAWFHPLGLVTPAVLGIAGAVVVFRVARRILGRPVRSPLGRVSPAAHAAGTLLGGAAGLSFAASVWILLSLGGGLLGEPRPEALGTMIAAAPGAAAAPAAGAEAAGTEAAAGAGWAQAIVRTANRGFVRHLPAIGPLGDEVEAVIFLLNASPEHRARLARKKEWQRIAELPSLREALRDQAVLDDLDAFGHGSIAALYRLQKNSLILAFFEEEEVRRLVIELRPSILAKEIEELAAAGAGGSDPQPGKQARARSAGAARGTR